MSTIEEARVQAREALATLDQELLEWLLGERSWADQHHGRPDEIEMTARADRATIQLLTTRQAALRALLGATEPSTVAVKTEFRVLDAPKDCDYHEGFEEGVKVGRAGSGPRPITDEMLGIMAQAFYEATHFPGSGIRYMAMTVKPEIVAGMRAALEAAEGGHDDERLRADDRSYPGADYPAWHWLGVLRPR